MRATSPEEGLGMPHSRRQSVLGRLATHGMSAVGVLLAFNLPNAALLADGTDFCQLTSQAALSSCREGARSDHWLALGKCDNLTDPAERQACRQQALADMKDALKLCDDQHFARQGGCGRLGGAPYDPVINPRNFVTEINNPFFPLKPGTTYIYEGQTAQGLEHNEVIVTHRTQVILGVTCIEVRDMVTVNGGLTEDTLDWYAQDRDGNVWYFGENAKQIVAGEIVDLAGSWKGGVDGAKPGIIMEAHPAVGDFYRQEFSLGAAEDVGEVLSLNQSVTVPFGSFDHCLKTRDTSPLEPDAVEHKFYAQGVGLVLDIDPSSGERLELVQVTAR